MSDNSSCEKLVISYLFPPSDDVSGIVQAKRILADKKSVDIVVSDSEYNSFFKLADFTDEYINNKIIIEMNGKPTDYIQTIFEFIEKAMEEIEKKNTNYKRISSICWRLANHFLALEYKFKHPDVFWSAEFSDPMLYTIFNEKRYDKLDNPEYIDKINGKILKLGDYPLIENPTNLYFIVEYLTYLFADEIVFTNTNQREVMLAQLPVDVYDMVMKKSRITPVPTLDGKYYHINETDVNIDKNNINIAYFGAYYANRNFESIFYAFDSLNHKYKDKIKFHMYVQNPGFLKEITNGLDIENNMIIQDIVEYLEFLNLTTKFDILLANDLVTKDNFKINPYLPSKLADYTGSGNDIWIIYERSSVMSEAEAKYKSDVHDYSTSRDVLIKILEDRGFVDDDISFDENYFDKRLTLFNEYYGQIDELKEKVKELEAENEKLQDNESTSKDSKLKKHLKKLKNNF